MRNETHGIYTLLRIAQLQLWVRGRKYAVCDTRVDVGGLRNAICSNRMIGMVGLALTLNGQQHIAVT